MATSQIRITAQKPISMDPSNYSERIVPSTTKKSRGQENAQLQFLPTHAYMIQPVTAIPTDLKLSAPKYLTASSVPLRWPQGHTRFIRSNNESANSAGTHPAHCFAWQATTIPVDLSPPTPRSHHLSSHTHTSTMKEAERRGMAERRGGAVP